MGDNFPFGHRFGMVPLARGVFFIVFFFSIFFFTFFISRHFWPLA